MDNLKKATILIINQSRIDNVEKLIGKQYSEVIFWSKYVKNVILVCYSSVNEYLYKQIGNNVYLIGVPFDLSTNIIKTLLNIIKNYFRLIFFLRKLCKKIKIDILGMENIIISGPVIFLISKINKIPYLIWLVGNEKEALVSKYKKNISTLFLKLLVNIYEKLILKSANFIFYFSHELRGIGLRRNVINGFLTPNFIDTNKFNDFHYKNKKNLNDKIKVLFVGRFSEEKGIKIIFKAINILKSQNLNFEILLVGDGYLKNWIKSYILKNKVSNVQLLGTFDHTEMPRIYNMADIFILPSYTEGSPASLIEAMSCGCASICSNVGECKYIIENFKSGILIPAGNYIELAEALKHLIMNHELIEKFRINGRKSVIKYSKNYASIHKFVFNQMIK